MNKNPNKPSWWALSFGAHFVVFGLLAAVVVIGFPLEDVEALSLGARQETPPPNMEEPYRIRDCNQRLVEKKIVYAHDIVSGFDGEVANSTTENEANSTLNNETSPFNADRTFRGPVFYDTVGAGGGGGGRHGGLPLLSG